MAKQTIDIIMPSLGADMTEGTLVEWLVGMGDVIKKGDIIAVIETSKSTIDMESYYEGVLSEIVVEASEKVPCGTVMARIQSDGMSTKRQIEAVSEGGSDVDEEVAIEVNRHTEEEKNLEPEPKAKPKTGGIPESRSLILASPVVRKLASKMHLDLDKLVGSGPSGAVLLRDIKNIDSRPVSTQSQVEAMRMAIAKAMERSKKEIPHYYITLDIDITQAQHWLQKQNADKPPEDRILLLALLLKAVANALGKFPALNGLYADDTFKASVSVHIGNVISLREGGLLVPAMHDVDQLTLDETMQALRDISQRSRTGRLKSSELMDATITVTSMGERGSDSVLGVIYPPQVAIIGFGKPRQVPQFKEESVVNCDVITASLSADHRVSDGIVGAKFLNAVAKQLQKPENL